MDSTDPIVANAQHVPWGFWFFTCVTKPSGLRSYEAGSVRASRAVPAAPFRWDRSSGEGAYPVGRSRWIGRFPAIEARSLCFRKSGFNGA